ncbi:MAG: hypothetical protein AB8B50_15510 [Pirellulaceae bacterium]
MTKRERFLAIAVGVVITLFAVQYGFNQISKTLADKQEAIDDEVAKSEDMDREITTGKIASRKLDQLRPKSLPNDGEMAVSQYRDWLFELAGEVDMEKTLVSRPEKPSKKTDAFNAYDFTLSGTCRTDRAIDLLAKFYDRDVLHSLRNFKMTMTKEPNKIVVNLDTRVLALTSAAPNQEASSESSGRLAMSVEEYKTQILDRNPFAPPNSAPSVANKKIEVELGKLVEHELEHKDAENHSVQYELADSDDIPDGLKLSGSTIEWEPKEAGEFKFPIQVTDTGWPSATSEEMLVISVAEPKEEEPEPEDLDIASQARVTGMVQGRDRTKKMWIRSRIEGRTLDLNEGEEFELGSIKAKVIEINLREDFAVLESKGMRWTVDMDTSLADAYQKGMAD